MKITNNIRLFVLSSYLTQCQLFNPQFIPRVNGGWGTWLRGHTPDCSGPCASEGQRTVPFVRFCDRPMPTSRGLRCEGEALKQVVEKCHTPDCPVDGGWGLWLTKEVGSCSATCGEGTQVARIIRHCSNPAPANGGANCSGAAESTLLEKCFSNCPEQRFKLLNSSFDLILTIIAATGGIILFLTGTYLLRRRRRRRRLIKKEGTQPGIESSENPALTVSSEKVET